MLKRRYFPIFNNLIKSSPIANDDQHLKITNRLSGDESVVCIQDYELAKQMDGYVFPGDILKTEDLDEQFEMLDHLYDEDLIRIDNGFVKSRDRHFFKALLMLPESFENSESDFYRVLSNLLLIFSLIMLIVGFRLFRWQPVRNECFSLGNFAILLLGGIFICPLVYFPFQIIGVKAYTACPIYEIGICVYRVFSYIYAFYDEKDVKDRFKIAKILSISSQGAFIVFGMCYVVLMIPNINEVLAYIVSIFGLSSLSFALGNSIPYLNSALEYIIIKLLGIRQDSPVLIDEDVRYDLYDEGRISAAQFCIYEFLAGVRSSKSIIPIGILVFVITITLLLLS